MITRKKLINWRITHAYTQAESAERIGVSLRTYQRWEEKGVPKGRQKTLSRTINLK